MMKRVKDLKINPDELFRSKSVILSKLTVLEEKLNKFRSSSPEKWVEEVGGGNNLKVSSYNDLITNRSSSDEALSSKNSEEIIKTIAENEHFIKQKIGGIENELHLIPHNILSESFKSLLEDVDRMSDGLIGLQEEIDSWNKQSKPPDTIVKGIRALQNGLRELLDIANLVINKKSFHKISENIKINVDESITITCKIQNKLIDKSKVKEIENDLNYLKNKFMIIKELLLQIQEHSPTLKEISQELKEANKEAKSKLKDLINVPTKSNNARFITSELLADLQEQDFIDSTISYEMADYILRSEEDAIASLREVYVEYLSSSSK